MNTDNWIVIVRVDPTRGDYFALLNALNTAGIAFIENDRIIGGYRTIYHMKDISVKQADISNAASVLNEFQTELSKATPSFCPMCDGETISEKTVVGFLGIFQKQVFYCNDCGYKWKPSQ